MLIRPAEHIHSTEPVEIRNLTMHYAGTIALDDVSAVIPAGQRVAVIGPNGAGKSTLFKAIAGTEKPTRGHVSVFGHKPGGHVCIAYVPQRSQIDWRFPVTVAEVVMMGRVRQIGLFHWPRKADWAVVDEALARVGMSAARASHIGELSGGQQQRVFLARAIAQQAEVILLDEPLNGLDAPSQEAIFDLLDEMHASGITVIVATHDLNLAAERFDQVILLNRRLVAIGTPLEVFTGKNLLQAYGGHMHVLPGDDGLVVLTDSCCDGDDDEPNDQLAD